MNIGDKHPIQGPSTQGRTLNQQFQNLIEDETGIHCDVMATPHTISIATADYASYLIARSVLKGRTSLEIIRG